MSDSVVQVGLVGRHQVLLADIKGRFDRPILAAGAVLWRRGAAGVEVACIHRPFYDDWSLAKGKVDAGESLVVTAAREIVEETGFTVQLGKLLGFVTYPIKGRTKVVYYWTAEVLGGEFVPNDEVDEVRWLVPSVARELLTYDVDRQVLDKAVKRLELAPVTSRVLYVRHAKAVKADGVVPDERRPLDAKGLRQAAALAELLVPFGPGAVYAAGPDRCVQTAAPVAAALGVDVVVDPMLGDAGWVSNMKGAKARFLEIVRSEGTSVVVSQGLTIPDVVAWLSAAGSVPIVDVGAKKASVWVLSFTDGVLTGADYVESPLPVK